MKRAAAFSLLLLLVAGVQIGMAGSTGATPGPDHKQGLCHRTASDTNPYVYIEVDVASLPAHLNNLPGHPAKTNPDGTDRNDFFASSPEDCVVGEGGEA